MAANQPTRAMALLAFALLALLPLAPAGAGPEIATWTTDNGARVLFVAAPDLPMVDARVAFAAGSARDGGQPGLASLTAELLTQGAADWDADAIAERLERVGAVLATGVDQDMGWVSLRTLAAPEAFAVATDTLARILAAPRFAPDDIERVRHNRLVALRLGDQDPATVASNAFYYAIYGNHPYATPSDGTEEAVARLRRPDFERFYRRYYVAANATIAIVGDLDRAQAKALATRLSDGLARGERAPPPPPVAELAAGAAGAIEFPSSQTHIIAGQPGMRRGDPDYFPLYVGNHILGGGGLVSLLMEEVREKRGLSYSVYSYLAPLAERGPLVLGLQTKNAQADEAQAVMLDTLRRFIDSGPSAEQLDAAIKNITGGFPLRIASNAKIGQYLTAIGFYDLPLDYLDRFSATVASVTAKDIQDAFQRRVHPERLRILRVGRRSDPVDAADSHGADRMAPASNPPSDALTTATLGQN